MIPLFRRGRHKIYATTSAEVERNIREQLQSLLGGLRVRSRERYSSHHGESNPAWVCLIGTLGLDDPEWEPGQAPHEIGRNPFGRISIANSAFTSPALYGSALSMPLFERWMSKLLRFLTSKFLCKAVWAVLFY